MPEWLAELREIFFRIVSSRNLWELAGIGLSSGIAAYFGARGAQRVISKNNTLEASRRDIHLISSAQMICLSIANSAMAMKRQHVRPLSENYSKQVSIAREGVERSLPTVHIQMDLQKLPVPFLATTQLEKILFENISLSGRALSAFNALIGAINLMRESIIDRNDLVDRWHEQGMEQEKILRKYLSFPDERGFDEIYSNLVDAILSYTNDVIFFSMILENDLRAIGEDMRAKFPGNDPPELPKISWSNVDELIPKHTEYSDWLKGFPNEPMPPSIP